MKCGKLLFKVVPSTHHSKYWQIHEATSLKLKSDRADYYYVCPHCKAKNIVKEERPYQLRIVRYKD
jgi:DNA-directed RNA polymerase subunit RPC12/RpoP